MKPRRIGLVLIVATHEGFAIAADGAQSNADGTVSEVQKVFQVGKYGAIALAGSVSIQDPIDRPVREEINVSRIVKIWLDAHPDASLDTANREINSLVFQAVTKFFSTRNPGAQAGKYVFGILCAGFVDGRTFTAGNRYLMPLAKGKPPSTGKFSNNEAPEVIWGPDGEEFVLQELMAGRTAALREFKLEPSVKKFRSPAPVNHSTQDFVNFFDTALRASESDEGKKFRHGSRIVAPPNRLATISAKDGFAWKK